MYFYRSETFVRSCKVFRQRMKANNVLSLNDKHGMSISSAQQAGVEEEERA